jgi:hypothetical protein
MNYQICIPSYKRYTILQHKTLNLLHKLNIPREIINIFVIEEEYNDYKLNCNPDMYNELIIGVKGLVEQRKFISNYYPENTHIISLDDDIESLDLSMTDYATADIFFKKAFEICILNKSFIWGVYPVLNPFFRKNQKLYTTELKFIIGAFFGFINRPNDLDLELKLMVHGNKEDVERSILYFKKDGVVIRFNKVGFKTKYYGTDGGGLGTLNNRLESMKQGTLNINSAYSELTKIKIRKNGLYEIVFKKQK